jgi:hypothetical protein
MIKQSKSYDLFVNNLSDKKKEEILNSKDELITNPKNKKKYYKVVGDACYRYRRAAKKAFFRNKILCRLFIELAPEIQT